MSDTNIQKESLNKKIIRHSICGKQHIDRDRFAQFDHQTHLCNFCNTYFNDFEKGIGVKEAHPIIIRK